MSALGFGLVSSDLVFSLILIGVIASTFFGYIADAVMGGSSLGVIGNALLAFGGAGAAMVGWNSFFSPIAASDPGAVIAAAAAGAIGLMMIVTVMRRLA